METRKTCSWIRKKYRDRDWLVEQYWHNGLSIEEVAAIAGTSKTNINRWMMQLDIPRRDRQGIGKRANYVDLTPEALEFIDGWMLGDLCVFAEKHNTISARIAFGTKHKDCTQWMSDRMASFGIEQGGQIHENIYPEMNNCRTFSYQSRYYRDLKPVRDRWYRSDRKKIVPRDIVLTPDIVRYWYIADGMLACPHHERPRIGLATHGFPEEDVEFLVSMLDTIGIQSHRQKRNSIYIPVGSVQDFLNYIGTCDKGLEHLYYYKWEIDRRGPIVSRTGCTISATLGWRIKKGGIHATDTPCPQGAGKGRPIRRHNEDL